MYIISGRDRKSGVARATEATATLAPLGNGYKQYANLKILVYMYSKTFRLSQISTLVRNATLNLIKRVYSGKILKQDLKLYKNILSKYYL